MSEPQNIPDIINSIDSNATIKVLMHHRVVPDDFPHGPLDAFAVRVSDFRKQLELLEQWDFTPITFNDYYLCQAGNLILPRRPVIITFDDGYLDNYDLAFPVLEEFSMKAVFFVLGDRKQTHNTWDITPNLPPAPLMTDSQILELHAAGHEIGSHSLTHVKLIEVNSEKAWDEISRSRQLLEILLNDRVSTFAYPYGLANNDVKRMVQNAGYSLACGVYSGPPIFADDPFEIRRIHIPGTMNSTGFAMRMLLPYEHYHWMRWKSALWTRGIFKKVRSQTNGEQNINSDQSSLDKQYPIL